MRFKLFKRIVLLSVLSLLAILGTFIVVPVNAPWIGPLPTYISTSSNTTFTLAFKMRFDEVGSGFFDVVFYWDNNEADPNAPYWNFTYEGFVAKFTDGTEFSVPINVTKEKAVPAGYPPGYYRYAIVVYEAYGDGEPHNGDFWLNVTMRAAGQQGGSYIPHVEGDQNIRISSVHCGETTLLSKEPVDCTIHVTPYHDVAIYKVEPNIRWVSLRREPVKIDIGVKNEGTELETFSVKVYVDNNVIGELVVKDLPPGSTRAYTGIDGVWWWTRGYAEGAYSIRAYAVPVPGETHTEDNNFPAGTVYLSGYGRFIIVAGGSPNGDVQDVIDKDCNTTYETLEKVGWKDDEIFYMNPTWQYDNGKPLTDALSSSAKIEWAINMWAKPQVDKTHPLFLYLHDHGGEIPWWDWTHPHRGEGWFRVNSGDLLYSKTLASWLSELKSQTNAPIYVICSFCQSGSFLADLSPIANVTICSSEESQNSGINDMRGVFDSPFWKAILEGVSIAQAFNKACEIVHLVQTPLLDDNNDGVGHTGPIPMLYDGKVEGFRALALYMGCCKWSFPWISSTGAKSCYVWFPPDSVTLWAKVENDTPILHVKAWMIPPDWSSPPVSNTSKLALLNFECFEMMDEDHNGNFTVNVPAVNFTNHATGPSNFTFIITVEQTEGVMAYPCHIGVAFTETGQPAPDKISPVVYVTRPLDKDIVHGTINVNGTTDDDVCLQKVELYVDSNLAQTNNLPKASNSFFEFSLDTTSLANGNHTIMVKTYDTSNNSADQTLTIYVINNVHDIATTNVNPAKSCVGEGFILNTEVTIVNQGSYAENLSATFYVNSTIIETKTITNLPVDALTTLTFTWNTTGWSKGNYAISAYAEPVQGETDTTDNTYVDGTVAVIPLVAIQAQITLNDLRTINVYVNGTFVYGNNLTVKFYSYSGTYETETTIWSGTTPAYMVLSMNVSHPLNWPIENATLVLTDEHGNILQTVTTFLVRRTHLFSRITQIVIRWPSALSTERITLFKELTAISRQWPYAPP